MFAEHCIKVDSIRITYSPWRTGLHLAFILALFVKYIDELTLGPLIYTFGTLNNLCTLCIIVYQVSALLSFRFFPRYSGILYIYLSPLAHGAIYLMFFYRRDEACANDIYTNLFNPQPRPPANVAPATYTTTPGNSNPAVRTNTPLTPLPLAIMAMPEMAFNQNLQQPLAPLSDHDQIVLHPVRLALHQTIDRLLNPIFIAIGTLLLAYVRRTVLGLLVFQQKLQTRFLNRWLYRVICCCMPLGIIALWLWYPYFVACWDLRKYSPTTQLLKNQISLSEWFGERCVSSWPKLLLISTLSGVMHLLWSSFFSYAYYYVDWEEYLRKGTAVWTVGGKVYYSKLY